MTDKAEEQPDEEMIEDLKEAHGRCRQVRWMKGE
jgi:hypothetical protein